MKTHMTLSAIATIGALAMSTAAEARGRIANREVRQQQRIGQGIESGQLTAREAARLEGREAHIARYTARSRADDGGLSRAERVRIEAMQDRTSRAIYRQKHDAQTR